ncbi:hypothetical protein CDL15_Pgr008096 [Punica granatum]|uniref:Uncharacterized protein n=1 Tax=Punica granatum TaxID=22663 RepID=A0A218W267_PUNGR|nr:hypothetical protein CDL15_Pgr008096 [Punica granatum]PKI36286.1 hypothetical protein CRG98_043312 [Punica granatum]
MERSRSPIGGPNLESTEDSESEVTNRGPQPLYRGCRDRGWDRQSAIPTPPLRSSASSVGTDGESSVDSGLRSPIGDPDLSTEVAGVLYGYRPPRWRDRSCRLVAPTSPSLSIFFRDNSVI